MTTIKLTGGDLGRETALVRADLRQAGGVIEVDYCEGSGWLSWWSSSRPCLGSCFRVAVVCGMVRL